MVHVVIKHASINRCHCTSTDYIVTEHIKLKPKPIANNKGKRSDSVTLSLALLPPHVIVIVVERSACHPDWRQLAGHVLVATSLVVVLLASLWPITTLITTP